MTRESIEKKILQVVCEISGMEECTLEMDLMDEVGMSSIAVMELICALEEEYGVKIPARALRFVATVEDMVDLVVERVSG